MRAADTTVDVMVTEGTEMLLIGRIIVVGEMITEGRRVTVVNQNVRPETQEKVLGSTHHPRMKI